MYVKAQNGKVLAFPYGFSELRRDNPNTSFPEIMTDAQLEEHSIFPVEPSNIPDGFDSITQNAVMVDPIFDGSKWRQEWSITPASEAEISQRLSDLSILVRAQRNELLMRSDWTQTLDSPVNVSAWASYRQKLRDITKQPGFPVSIDWPTEP